MPNLTSSDLSDLQPPLPGERERALVANRAHELGRRRRLLQGGGALTLVAAVAVSVAALTAGGSSGPGGTNRVETASGTDTSVSTPVSHVTTAPPTVVTTVPAPAPDTTPATTAAPVVAPQDVAPVEPATPTTFTLSGTVTGNPADTTATLTLKGDGGTFTVPVDGAGNYSVSGLPAGDYLAVGFYTDTATGTASTAVKFGTVSVTQNSTSHFTFPS